MLKQFFTRESYLRLLYDKHQIELFSNKREFYSERWPCSMPESQDFHDLTPAYTNSSGLSKDTELVFVNNISRWFDEYSYDNRFFVSFPYVLIFRSYEDEGYNLFQVLTIQPPYESMQNCSEVPIINTNLSTDINLDVQYRISSNILHEGHAIPIIPKGTAMCSLSPEEVISAFGVAEDHLNTIILIKIEDTGARLLDVEIKGSQPSPRAYVAMAKISKNTLVFHGGNDNARIFSDTFILKFNGNSCECTEIITSPSAPQMSSHFMACHDNSIILFGGTNKATLAKSSYKLNLQTYEWSEFHYTGCRLLAYNMNNEFYIQSSQIGPLFIISVPFTKENVNLTSEKLPSHPDYYNGYRHQRWIIDLNLQRSTVQLSVHRQYHSDDLLHNTFAMASSNNFLGISLTNIYYGKILPGNYYNSYQVPSDSSSLHSLLHFIFGKPILTDIKIQAEGGSIDANLLFLASRRSESAMLLKCMLDGVITLKFPYDIIKSAILYLYCEEIHCPWENETSEFLEELQKFACNYQMHSLKALCKLAMSQEGKLVFSKHNLYQDYRSLAAIGMTSELSLERIDSGLEDSFLEFLSPDFMIISSSSVFHCHKAVLFLRSGHVRGVVSVDNAESAIELNDYSERAIAKMLEYVYYDALDISADCLPEILALATYLQIYGLKLHAEKSLCKFIDNDNALSFYQISRDLNCQHLQKFIEDFVRFHYQELTESFDVVEEDSLGMLKEEVFIPPEKIEYDCENMDDVEVSELIAVHLDNEPLPSLKDPCPPGMEDIPSINSDLNALVNDIENIEAVKTRLLEHSNLGNRKPSSLEKEFEFVKKNMFDALQNLEED